MNLTDAFGRPLRDLRISVTDRCNFRCIYCMPREIFGPDYAFLARNELLSYEEIHRLARIFADLGIKKIRLTGGEPLVRKGLEQLIETLASLPISDLTLTTNGSLLPEKAHILKDAGLQRVTVSLDSLDNDVFAAMNDADFPVDRVLEGIEAARVAGLTPIKINMVVKRCVNENSILPMARYFRGTDFILRFIEYMDVGSTNDWQLDDVIPAHDIIAHLNAEFPIEPIDANYRGEVAKRWQYKDGSGEIGVIASVTQPFCGDCTRVRLSAEGKLYTCLFASEGFDLRQFLRSNQSDTEIADAIASIWRKRHDRYSEIRSSETAGLPKVEMSYIGG